MPTEMVSLFQAIALGLIRSDVMLGAEPEMPMSSFKHRQVEVNTIAAGFGWLGPVSGHLHRLAAVNFQSHFQSLLHRGQMLLHCPNSSLISRFIKPQDSNKKKPKLSYIYNLYSSSFSPFKCLLIFFGVACWLLEGCLNRKNEHNFIIHSPYIYKEEAESNVVAAGFE